MLSIPPHLNFAHFRQIQNSKIKSKNNKFFNLSSNDDENAKPKAKNLMKILEIITLHEQIIFSNLKAQNSTSKAT